MKTLNIVAVFALLFSTNNAVPECEDALKLINVLNNVNTDLNETRAELKKVKAELAVEKNKTCKLPHVEPTPAKPLSPVEFECTFENISACGYEQPDITEVKWFIGTGPPNTTTTGPVADHTFGKTNGHYMFINGMDEAQNTDSVLDIMKSAVVTFPPITPNKMSEFCISFWYSMHGKDVRDLKFHLEGDGMTDLCPFVKKGNQGPKWQVHHCELPKTNATFSFGFEATTNAYHQSDYIHHHIFDRNVECNIAIDDIQVIASPCPRKPVVVG